MTRESTVTLDCIVFGLQRVGGISNYWARLLSGGASRGCSTDLVLPRSIRYAPFQADWLHDRDVLTERVRPAIARYLPSPVLKRSDIFHTSYYRTPARKVRQSVVTVYDFTYERYRTGIAREVHTRQKLRSIHQADAVLCISEATRRDVFEFCPRVDAGKVHVVPLGVDTALFFPDRTSLHHCGEDMVLFVGQRSGYKRFDLAVAALQRTPRLRLGIVGPALDIKEKSLLTAALGARWIEFGPVGNEQLRQLYSEAHAFLFPSDYEGFGLPVLEAMACGCPVIAAERSSLPEVGGEAALYAPEQNGEAYAAALGILESTSVRAQKIAEGLSRVQRFTWSATLDRTISFYRP